MLGLIIFDRVNICLQLGYADDGSAAGGSEGGVQGDSLASPSQLISAPHCGLTLVADNPICLCCFLRALVGGVSLMVHHVYFD